MSFLSGTQLQTVLEKAVGKDFKASRINQAAYELSLGDQVYRTDSPTKKREILDDKDSQVIINPGQFALLITKETVAIPDKYLAFISIKFHQKIKGLVNVSGFHVDPGFDGKIIFSVYNAGPTPIMMDKGKPYFLIWFSTLSEPVKYAGAHQNQNEISAELIEQLKGDLASPNALLSHIKKVEERFVKKSDELTGRKKYVTWLYQAILIVLIGLLITEFHRNDQLSTAYQTGFQASEAKQQLKNEMIHYIDSFEVKKSVKVHNLQRDSSKKLKAK